MFPIRDHNPSTQTPYITYALIAANVGVFLLYADLLGDPYRLQQVFLEWGMVPLRISYGDGYTTFLTSMFMHGGIMHLAGNMLFLWIFGDNLEEDLGRPAYLGFYLVCGLLAGLAHYIADPSSNVPTVGASGAIAGVMGGYLLFYPRAKVDVLFIIVIIFRIIPIPAWIMLGVWFAIQLGSGALSDPSLGGVAYWAHAGGFVAGFALLLPAWIRRGGTAFWARTEGHPDHPAATYRNVRSSIPRVPRRRR